MTEITNRKAMNPRRGQLQTLITRDPDWILKAQCLRYEVFSATYDSDLGAGDTRLDCDDYDQLCDHILVIDLNTGEPVATSRILCQDDLPYGAQFYSEQEFELEALRAMPGRIAELGRTCIAPSHRTGAAISLLWQCIAAYLIDRDVDYLIGCASISMADGGYQAAQICDELEERFPSAPEQRVIPRKTLPRLTNANPGRRTPAIPPLIRAYMRMGATICGAACWDPEFRCADLPVLLEVKHLSDRYSRHFFRQGNNRAA